MAVAKSTSVGSHHRDWWSVDCCGDESIGQVGRVSRAEQDGLGQKHKRMMRNVMDYEGTLILMSRTIVGRSELR